MQGDGTGRRDLGERALWHKSRVAEAVEDDAARFLDLAGFADGRLDPDDRERVAEWLAADPDAAADVAAARAMTTAPESAAAPLPESVVARACALVAESDGRHGTVIPFPTWPQPHRRLHGLAHWGSLAAAVAVASWLGFTLGVDTSQSLAPPGISGSQARQQGVLRELLDPSTGLMRDFPGGTRT
jgi:anti-sigma factor RsiW